MNRKVFVRTQCIGMLAAAAGSALSLASATAQQPFFFSTGNPDGRIAAASRAEAGSSVEIEAADDFILSRQTTITGATFTGILPVGASLNTITGLTVEIYRVFPLDSDTTRTPHVPTRTNSPSDVAFDSRDRNAGTLGVYPGIIAAQFTAANSVINGIHQSPNQTTGGEGAVTGEEVQFSVTFDPPFHLAPDHYFFIPQVQLSSGQFYWLSAPKPIVAPGTPFVGDLQAWIRDGNLDPDWLRIGTDIVGGSPAPTFNMTFTLNGTFDCYANCDGSTSTPALNVNDFICFQASFAAGDTYANCDGSTTPPVLNVNDFLCFQYRFAAGCSAP